MKSSSFLVGIAVFVVFHAEAQQGDWIFQNDVRLRWEAAESGDRSDKSSALTLRLRPSFEHQISDKIEFVAELDGIFVLSQSNPDVSSLPNPRLKIFDEETIELNRFLFGYAPTQTFQLKVGRQGIQHGEERFIGSSNFRQNQQTYDAITAYFEIAENVQIETGYIWQVNRILPAKRDGGEMNSDSYYAVMNTPTPFGMLEGFYYNMDLARDKSIPFQAETFGASLTGRTYIGDLGVLWRLSGAQQESESSRADYLQGRISASWSDFTFTGQFERLGSNEDGISFQTPLASLHKYQGFIDVFSITPPDGVQDIQAELAWRIGSAGPFRGLSATLQLNDFQATETASSLGREYSFNIGGILKETRLGLAIASYQEEGFSEDTQRLWVTIAKRF